MFQTTNQFTILAWFTLSPSGNCKFMYWSIDLRGGQANQIGGLSCKNQKGMAKASKSETSSTPQLLSDKLT